MNEVINETIPQIPTGPLSTREPLLNLTYADVFKAYRLTRLHKSNTRSCREFEMNLYHNIYVLWQDLIHGRYVIGKSTCFVVTIPKYREVFAADFRDRIVHHIVVEYMMPKFEDYFIRNSFSCMDGRGTSDGILKLQEAMKRHPKGWVAKFDLVGFFMNINKNLLLDITLDFVKSWCNFPKDISDILNYLLPIIILHHPEENCIRKCSIRMWDKIDPKKSLFKISKDKGMAIGNLTSQLFAGLYLMSFDYMMHSIFGEDYGRYVDDFYIVAETKEEILSIIPRMESCLKELGLRLHPDKRYIQPVRHGCKFIGSMVYANRIYVGNGTLSNFRRSIHRYNALIKSGIIDEDILLSFIRSVNSYLGFMVNYSNFKYRKKLINMIDSEWFNFIQVYENSSIIRLKPEYRFLNRL